MKIGRYILNNAENVDMVNEDSVHYGEQCLHLLGNRCVN